MSVRLSGSWGPADSQKQQLKRQQLTDSSCDQCAVQEAAQLDTGDQLPGHVLQAIDTQACPRVLYSLLQTPVTVAVTVAV